MGYDIHITRQINWFDNEPRLKISIQEWLEYIEKDPEMRLDNFAEAELPDGTMIRNESEGLSVWTKYSGDGLKGNHAWFDYHDGRIVVKNPDDEIISKMLEIAAYFNATVQGDQAEIYRRTAEGRIVDNQSVDKLYSPKKAWWKFW